MLKTGLWKFGILAALAIFGAWLVGLLSPERTTENATGYDVFVAFLGLISFSVGSLGIVALAARHRGASRPETRVWWEIERTKGRPRFIREETIKTFVVLVVILIAPVLYNAAETGSWTGSIIGCLVIAFFALAASYAIADRLWNYYQNEFKSSSSSQDRSEINKDDLTP